MNMFYFPQIIVLVQKVIFKNKKNLILILGCIIVDTSLKTSPWESELEPKFLPIAAGIKVTN